MFRSSPLPLLGVPLESRILEMAFISSQRFVGLEDRRGRLACFDLNGQRIWDRGVKSIYPSPGKIRVAHGFIWLDCGNHIARFDFDGNRASPFRFELGPNEKVGWFVVGADNVGVSIYQDLYQPQDDELESATPLLNGRVVRLNLDGTVRWSCELPAETLAFSGVVSASRETGWQTQPKAGWSPRSWKCDCYVNDGLLLSGDTLLASFIEDSSGIGLSYAVRWSDGVLLWTTDKLPFTRRAICGDGEFAFSVGGYGTSRTFVLNAQGQIAREWKGNGALCVDADADLWLVEEANYVGEPCGLWQLKANGEAHEQAPISSGRGSFPSLSQDGLVFWRDGQLVRVGDGATTVLNFKVGDPESRVLSRTLLDEQGQLVFATAGSGVPSEGIIKPMLWIAQEKVAPLLKAPWPCGDGNPQANPVWREEGEN